MSKRHGLSRIHLAVLLFGFAGLFGKLLPMDPMTITFGRTFFAGIALFAVLSLTGKNRSLLSYRDLLSLFFSGFILAAHWFSFFQSIQSSSVAIGLLTFSSFPLFVTLMEPFLFGERLEGFDVMTALLVVAGLVGVVPAYDFSNRVTQGVLWGTFSGFTFAVLSLLNRRHVGRYPPLVVSSYQLSFAALITLPPVILSGVPPSGKDLVLLVILGLVFTALAQTLFIGSLKHIKAQLASITIALEPVYGITFAFILLHEIPTWRTLIGGLLIMGAVTAASLRPFMGTAPGSNRTKKPI